MQRFEQLYTDNVDAIRAYVRRRAPEEMVDDVVADVFLVCWRRLDVVPGITGLWQVSGRSNLTFDEMALLDIWYIENWSIGLDVKLMFRTIPAVLLGTGAY